MTWLATFPAITISGKGAVRAIFADSGSIMRLMSELMSAWRTSPDVLKVLVCFSSRKRGGAKGETYLQQIDINITTHDN